MWGSQSDSARLQIVRTVSKLTSILHCSHHCNVICPYSNTKHTVSGSQWGTCNFQTHTCGPQRSGLGMVEFYGGGVNSLYKISLGAAVVADYSRGCNVIPSLVQLSSEMALSSWWSMAFSWPSIRGYSTSITVSCILVQMGNRTGRLIHMGILTCTNSGHT